MHIPCPRSRVSCPVSRAALITRIILHSTWVFHTCSFRTVQRTFEKLSGVRPSLSDSEFSEAFIQTHGILLDHEATTNIIAPPSLSASTFPSLPIGKALLCRRHGFPRVELARHLNKFRVFPCGYSSVKCADSDSVHCCFDQINRSKMQQWRFRIPNLHEPTIHDRCIVCRHSIPVFL